MQSSMGAGLQRLSANSLSATLATALIVTGHVLVVIEMATGSEGSCGRYNTWSSCVRDSCSRTGKFPSNSQCSYCHDDYSQGCAALKDMNCQGDKIATQGDCSPVQLKHRSCLLTTLDDSFTLNLTHISAIEGVNSSSGEYYAVGLCGDIQSRDTCGRQSQCGAPILIKGGSPSDPCWTVGNVTEMTTHVSSNLSHGVIIGYGSTDCCPLGSSAPGVTGKLRVELLVVPHKNCSSVEEWTVHQVPHIDILKNCSLSTNGIFRVELGTRWLCPGSVRVLWKLSSSLSTLKCEGTNRATGNQLNCQFHPMWASNTPADWPIMGVCQRLRAQVYSKEGSKQIMPNKLDKSSRFCSFNLTITENIGGVGVIDYNGARLGNVVSLDVPHSHTASIVPVVGSSVSVAGCGLLVIAIVLAICYWRRRKGTADEHQALLRTVDQRVVRLEQGAQQRHIEVLGAFQDGRETTEAAGTQTLQATS